MEKEIKLAIQRGHYIFVKSLDGSTMTGLPERSDDRDTLRMRTTFGPCFIPFNEIHSVSRIITMK